MKIVTRAFIPAAIALVAAALAAPSLRAQDFDFKTLDKLSAIAKSSTNVTLDGTLLQLASGILGNDHDKDSAALRSVVAKLKGVYVRAYEFDKPGQYSESDVAPLRAFLKPPKWTTILEMKEAKEWTQIFLAPAANNKIAGLAVVSTEPTSLTVVYIDGELTPADLEKLSGNMGIPEIRGLPGSKSGEPGADNKSKSK